MARVSKAKQTVLDCFPNLHSRRLADWVTAILAISFEARRRNCRNNMGGRLYGNRQLS
jgi:hypothetical protein